MHRPAPSPRGAEAACLASELDRALLHLSLARDIIMGRRVHLTVVPFPARADARSSVPLRRSGVTVAEAAARLGLSPSSVRRMLRTGELQGKLFDGPVGWRIDRKYFVDIARQWDATRLVRCILAGGAPW